MIKTFLFNTGLVFTFLFFASANAHALPANTTIEASVVTSQLSVNTYDICFDTDGDDTCDDDGKSSGK